MKVVLSQLYENLTRLHERCSVPVIFVNTVTGEIEESYKWISPECEIQHNQLLKLINQFIKSEQEKAIREYVSKTLGNN